MQCQNLGVIRTSKWTPPLPDPLVIQVLYLRLHHVAVTDSRGDDDDDDVIVLRIY